MSESHPNSLLVALHLNVLPSIPMLPGDSNSVALYPYQLSDLSVIFFYGSDYHRHTNNHLFSRLKIFTFNWTNLFVILTAMALCFVRRRAKLLRDDFMAVLIDVLVIFIGGQQLRMNHKIERWFFVITSIAAFFLNAICLGPTLFPSYLRIHQNVDTFQELAQVNPPIYLRLVLRDSEDLIKEMLRYAF